MDTRAFTEKKKGFYCVPVIILKVLAAISLIWHHNKFISKHILQV